MGALGRNPVAILALALFLGGCAAPGRPPGEFEEILATPDQTEAREKLESFIRRRLYDLTGYAGPMGGIGQLSPTSWFRGSCRGRPFVLIHLTADHFYYELSEHTERFLLLDREGGFLDTATAKWPSGLKHRLRSEVVCRPAEDTLAIRIIDGESKEFRGSVEEPCFSLHSKSEYRGERIRLPWTGTPLLGALEIRDNRFVVVSPIQ